MNVHEIPVDQHEQFLKETETCAICYFSPKCITCKLIEYYFHHMKEGFPEIHLVKYNVDQNEELRKKLQIIALPTVFFYRQGIVVNRYIGTTEMTLKKLLEELQSYAVNS